MIELRGNSVNYLKALPINEKGIVLVELIIERFFCIKIAQTDPQSFVGDHMGPPELIH